MSYESEESRNIELCRMLLDTGVIKCPPCKYEDWRGEGISKKEWPGVHAYWTRHYDARQNTHRCSECHFETIIKLRGTGVICNELNCVHNSNMFCESEPKVSLTKESDGTKDWECLNYKTINIKHRRD